LAHAQPGGQQGFGLGSRKNEPFPLHFPKIQKFDHFLKGIGQSAQAENKHWTLGERQRSGFGAGLTCHRAVYSSPRPYNTLAVASARGVEHQDTFLANFLQEKKTAIPFLSKTTQLSQQSPSLC
jgi:hypothetical protein